MRAIRVSRQANLRQENGAFGHNNWLRQQLVSILPTSKVLYTMNKLDNALWLVATIGLLASHAVSPAFRQE
jgi:hypothetical protein